MSGLKRTFPFSEEDVPYTMSSDIISVKRPCLPSQMATTIVAPQLQSVGINSWEHSEMEQDTYPANYCKNGTLTFPGIQNGDITAIEVTSYNNNNNSTNSAVHHVCIRCQAGEPGHIGHIGR